MTTRPEPTLTASRDRRSVPLARNPRTPAKCIRVVLLSPADRAAPTVEATAYIRAGLELASLFFQWDIVRRPVFERAADGGIRVIPVVSPRPLKEWHGEGAWDAQFGPALNDTIGTGKEHDEALRDTVWLVFLNSAVPSPKTPATPFRGYIGSGAPQKMVMSLAPMYYLPPWLPAASSKANWSGMVKSALADPVTSYPIQGTKIQDRFPSVADDVVRLQTRAEQVGRFVGVLAHEMTHALGIVEHDDGTFGPPTPAGLMGSGYRAMGESLRIALRMGPSVKAPLLCDQWTKRPTTCGPWVSARLRQSAWLT